VWGFGGLGEACALRSGIGDVDPDKTVLLFAGIAAGIDAIELESLIGSERGDEVTLSVVHIELPSVIRAFEILAVELAAVERHTAVGAGVAKSEGVALAITTDDEGKLQQRRLVKLIAVNAIGRQGAIPEVGEHQGIGCLALRKVKFGHGLRAYASIRWALGGEKGMHRGNSVQSKTFPTKDIKLREGGEFTASWNSSIIFGG
jgi:hypothetical protein